MDRGVRTTLAHLEDDELARVIVYTQSRPEADRLGQRLLYPIYYSDSGSVEEKERAFKDWR